MAHVEGDRRNRNTLCILMSQVLQNLFRTPTTVLIILVPRKAGAANTTGSMQVMWIPEDSTKI